MGKASSSKKVSRVARTGGGRTKRSGQSSSLLFPAVIGMAVVLGVFLIWFSRDQRKPDTSPPQPGDHWHAALGFNVCGQFAPSIPDNGLDPLGIHTHGDGVIHVHPFTSLAGGRRAALGLFLEALDLDVNEDRIDVPGAEPKNNGDLCSGQPGRVQVKVWDTRSPTDSGRTVSGDPADIRLGDHQLITIAFLPDGADLPKPPSEPQLDNLSDVPGASTTTTSVLGTSVLGTTTTSAPATTTTAAPTTTVAP